MHNTMQCFIARQRPAVQPHHIILHLMPKLGPPFGTLQISALNLEPGTIPPKPGCFVFCQNISNCFSRLNNTFYIEQENPPISLRVLSSSHASSSLLDHMKVANSSAMSNSHLQTHPNLIVLSLLVYCILYKPVYIYNDRHLGLVFPKCSESTLRTRPNLHT